MNEVQISAEGIVKNILSLNYTTETAMKEYLNNVLDKNTHPDYSIQFNMKDVFGEGQVSRGSKNMFMFECVEENACGFTSMDEIQRAFRIADSERTGTNNMGYGIFSPITINNGHEACGLFLQNTEKGSYYSLVYFTARYSKIWTHQGEIVDDKILGRNVSQHMVKGGTRFIWITYPLDPNVALEDLQLDINDVLKFALKYYNRSKDMPVLKGNILDEFKRLGAYYVDYLNESTLHPRKIFYDDEQLTPIEFLKKKDGSEVEPHTYEIRATLDDTFTPRWDIKDTDDNWKQLTTQPKKPIGTHPCNRKSARIHENPTATVKIYDVGDTTRKKKSEFRKFWVKLDDTYIFSEDISMNGWSNCRVVLDIKNRGDNEFKSFISPDPNKSNSSIVKDLKIRLTALVKYTLNLRNFAQSNRESVPTAVKHEAWEMVMGNVCRGQCTMAECTQGITAWKYEVTRINPLVDNIPENLTPICKACVR